MADYRLKISCTPNHPTTETLTDKWTYHYGKFDRGREPFGTTVKEIIQKAQITDIPKVPPATCQLEVSGNTRPAVVYTRFGKVKSQKGNNWTMARNVGL